MGLMTPEVGIYTREDLESVRRGLRDASRAELVDGEIIVTPSPSWAHQAVVRELTLRLASCVPDDLELFFAPLDVVLDERTVLQPDVLVITKHDADRASSGETERPGPQRVVVPVLAVEVLSPSTRRWDLVVKRERLARAGCPHYWVIDHAVPAITVFDLVDEELQATMTLVADESATLAKPFEITLCPNDLLR